MILGIVLNIVLKDKDAKKEEVVADTSISEDSAA